MSPAAQGQQQLWNTIRSSLIAARKGSQIQRVDRDRELPLSLAQQRFWLIEQLSVDSSVNNLRVAFRLVGQLDVTALEWSLGEIVRRHEILRTTFELLEGKPTQRIAADAPREDRAPLFALQIIDLQHLPKIERESAAQQQLAQLAQQPFDLAQDYSIRAALIHLSPDIHQMIVIMHHMVCDGVSIEILLQELTTLYQAYTSSQSSPPAIPNSEILEGRDIGLPSPQPSPKLGRGSRRVKLSPLRNLPIQYADFAVWQHQRVESGILAAQLDYWQQQLGGSLPILQLPTDRWRSLSEGESRPPIQTHTGAYQFFELPQHLATDLQLLSQRSGVTLFMTCLAAFQTLLYRYSGQEDIIVGTPISGRNRTEIEGSIGCFINTLALRTNLEHNPSFEELLSRVQQVALAAYAHQDLPFEKLIEALNPVRDLSRSPLFQAMFIFENQPRDNWTLPGLTIVPIAIPSTISNFDITLDLQATATGIRGGIEYNTDLFDPTTIDRMLGHFQILLAGIVANPAQGIANLPLLTPAEQDRILVEWNCTQGDYPNSCIHQLFEAQVERTPTAIAIVCENTSITYHQLNCRANQLADRLHRIGVTTDVLVGILMERSIELVVGLLGILKAGGAYVPLDPSYPPARLSYMLADAGVEILVTQPELLAAVPSDLTQVVCLDPDWQQGEDYCPENINRGCHSEQLAYVLYTSGSTGQPKGVAIEHRNVVNFLAAMRHAPGIEPEDTLAAVTTISFDIAALELYLPLTIGAKVVVVPREIAIDANLLLATLRQSQTTILQATPATWRLLLAGGWDHRYPLKALCGGEALPDLLAQQIIATGSQLWNLYGPTETTIWSTIYQVNPTKPVASSDEALISIGRPIANTQIYILNHQLQPVPIGVAGELYIGGAGLVRGYLHRPDLTAAKFIPDPFSTAKSARLYQTGDLARYSSDGNIEFLGRIDDLVKIRGFRIELGEIETALSQHAKISQAVVVTRAITPGNQSLIAYIVPHLDAAPTPDECRSFLRAKLPEYMMPAVFVLLETLPLTANGKIDRRALPLPDRTSLEPGTTFAAPKDGLELQLTKMWERVLGMRSIGTNDNFFDLGGHSLLAVQLFAEIGTTFGKNLPLATLFHSPTIEQLATILRQESGSPTWSSLVPISARGSQPPLFCAHSVGGNVLEYYPLAAHLGSAQPIYGLQSPGLDGVQAPIDSIEAMATHYIHEIQTVQPHGPYFLIGYSFGALVAFEIACQLERQGETIGLLASIDNAAPSLLEVRPPFWQSMWIHLQNLYQLNTSAQIKYVKERLVFRTQYQHKQNSEIEFLIDRWGTPLPPEYRQVLTTNFQAAENYTGKFYQGQVKLFRSGVQPLTRALHPDLGWGKLVGGGVEIHALRGQHTNLLKEPYIQILAEKLKLWLT